MISRFVEGGGRGAYENLAMEEAILETNEGLVVRVWDNEKSVIIGRAQLARYETDLEYCEAKGIPVVRRMTAGGAVYHGPGNLNWSLFVGREFEAGQIRYVWDVHRIFRMAASLINNAVGGCGVRTWLEEPNRIVSADGKVGGMAAYISKDGLLCHGTLLLNADLDEANRLTRPSVIELDRRYTRSSFTRVANTKIDPSSFKESLLATVEREIGREPEVGGPTRGEIEMTQTLLQRYREPRWNLGDPFAEIVH